MAKWITMGAAAVDTIVKVPRLPKADEIVYPISIEQHPGGSTANIAVGLSRLGETVSFFGKAGDDANKVILSSGLICSDKYASEGLTSKNSLEIYISGKDIQRLHAGLYSKEKWDANPEAVKKEIVQSQMTKP